MSRFPALPARRPGRVLLLAFSLALIAAAGCSEKPKRAAKAKAPPTSAAAKAKPPVCPLGDEKTATAQAVGGLKPGLDIQVVRDYCVVARAQGGQVGGALTYATQGLWVVSGRDSVRALAAENGKLIEVDALTPGFRTTDSLHVGSTLGDILQRRPAAARDGGLAILMGQLVVPPAGRCGLYLVLQDGLAGQQISLSPAEIAQKPRSLRVKRLAVLGGC